MSDATQLDSLWLGNHPLPVHGMGTTKNSRGRVLAIGGSRTVPGALRLTGEAALRVGAGKLQLATVASAAMTLGLLVPEAGSIALPENGDGEIADTGSSLQSALEHCDVVVLGPGISDPDAASNLLEQVLQMRRTDLAIVIDAIAIGCLKHFQRQMQEFAGDLVLTPNHAEIAVLTGTDEKHIADQPESIARQVAADTNAVVALKGTSTVVAAPDGHLLDYAGGGTGLATAGSGDVLAGAIGGLLSRGTAPLVATGWGVWLHGQSGRRVANLDGPLGFLARDLPQEFPKLLPQ